MDVWAQWIDDLAHNDPSAQERIWALFARRVTKQAKSNLAGVQCRESDEEDVAARVLNSLFQRIADGRQTPPKNREELWKLLVGMTRNKSAEAARHKLAQKRGQGRVRGESAFKVRGDDSSDHGGIHNVADPASDPKTAFEEAQQLTGILASLNDSQLRQIALLKMAGHTDQEIAELIGCSLRTVERRTAEIRDLLKDP